jgi:serine/threonine-protein kinase HipA
MRHKELPHGLHPTDIPGRSLGRLRADVSGSRVDLTDWADVLAALPVPDRERRMLALALSRFAAQIERLPDIMEAQGVDHDIIEFLAQSIDTQVRQLKALQSPEAHHAPSEPTYP